MARAVSRARGRGEDGGPGDECGWEDAVGCVRGGDLRGGCESEEQVFLAGCYATVRVSRWDMIVVVSSATWMNGKRGYTRSMYDAHDHH